MVFQEPQEGAALLVWPWNGGHQLVTMMAMVDRNVPAEIAVPA